ncbi:Transcriptional regulator, LysR family [Nostocoides japonicum T1-X7]|uniref:Transcriptional regulator, LysR family n=1 Tax=Nostocoides japonicum T1-X7 TaxID=1194083 RepID=A0A077M2M0_9MICO|nr:LysR family transcriptional regulator [Tetrasphaera japonica]CCH80066.1 Transcriptional regulator, LysR family [Tetrasphaera japonica T1-X7]
MLIRDLSWLTALAEYGQVTDTAAILRVSQPTLSRALARIEGELGAPLFERTSSGVEVTPDGEVAVAAARSILATYTRLMEELAARHDPDTGVVRLAFLDSLATSLVPGLLRGFHAQAPGIRIQLTQEPAHEMLRDVDRGSIELAITSDRPDGDFGWHPLQDERLVAIVPPTHRLVRRRRIDLAELADDPLITTPVGFGYRHLLDGLLRDAGIAPPITFESADLVTIEGLVAAGLGVSVVPEQLAAHTGSVPLRLTTREARRTIGVTWRTDRTLLPPAGRFLAYLQDNAVPPRPDDSGATMSETGTAHGAST